MSNDIDTSNIDLNAVLDVDGVEIGRAQFIRIAHCIEEVPENHTKYATFFELKDDGIYLAELSDWDLLDLTDEEAEALTDHPTGRPHDPVLSFPFTPKQFKVFLNWALESGFDVPIRQEVLIKIVRDQQTKQSRIPISPFNADNVSDTTLGAMTRQRNRAFANKARDGNEQRQAMYRQWYDAALEIRQRYTIRPPSFRELAKRVKELLAIPDALDTIRIRLSSMDKELKLLNMDR